MAVRVQLRIVAGKLRGRKFTCNVDKDLRPIPDMVRQALFSILGNAVPDRIFYDIFAGTGSVGLEAHSRGARKVIFVERDPRVARQIEQHLHSFAITDQAIIQRADAYRWAERWHSPAEPVNLFLGPPYPDLERRLDQLVQMVGDLQTKAFPGSVLILQAESRFDVAKVPGGGPWDVRKYGRNQLLIWVKDEPSVAE